MDGAGVSQVPSLSEWCAPVGEDRHGQTHGANMSFGEFARQWMECASVAWKPSQLETVQSILRAHLMPAFGGRPLDTIRRQDVLAFRARLVRTAPGRQGRTQLSAARANRVLSVLRQILLEAQAQYAIPAATHDVAALPVRRSEVRPFTWRQVEQLVAAAAPPWQDYVLARFLTGLRSGEVNGLRWDQVDLGRRVLEIRCARVRGREVLPKTEYSARDLPISAPLHALLLRQAQRTGQGPGWVFLTPQGHPVDTANFANRIWPAILVKAGLPHRRPYETRHTYATLMLASGEQPAFIATALGHADPSMLWNTYARYVPNLTRRDGAAFEATLQSMAGNSQQQERT